MEGQGRKVEEARTVAVNTLVFFEIFYRFNSRFLLRSSLSVEGLFGRRAVLFDPFVRPSLVFRLRKTAGTGGRRPLHVAAFGVAPASV